MNPIKAPSEPPPIDLGDELLAYAEQHPEKDNYIERTATIVENYVQRPIVPFRPSSPATVTKTSHIPAHKYEVVLDKEQQLSRQIGIVVAEVKPLLKNTWERCVLL